MAFLVSTDRLITSSEARKCFGKLIKDVSTHKDSYFVILDNGKIAALIVSPLFLQKSTDVVLPNLENIRSLWPRYSEEVRESLANLDAVDEKKLPKLLQ